MIVTVEDCDCDPGSRYVVPWACGGLAEYYDDELEAELAFADNLASERNAGRYLYWGVHLRGRHVIAVV